MFGFSPFRKKGVPSRNEAMAALGVDVKGSNGDRGSKGLDEIGLSEEERQEVEASETKMWTQEQLIEWGTPHGFTRNSVREDVEFTDTQIVCNFVELFLFNRDRLTKLPPFLNVKKLTIEGSEHLTTLPTGLKVHKLDAADCRSLTTISPGSEFGALDITRSHVRIIPNGTRITEELKAYGSDLQYLPEHLEAAKVDVGNSALKKLPIGDHFTSFYANNTLVEEIPAGFSAAHCTLAGSRVKKMADGYTGSSLNLLNTPLSQLGEALTVRSINLTGTNVTEIPASAQIQYMEVSKDQEELIQAAEVRGITLI